MYTNRRKQNVIYNPLQCRDAPPARLFLNRIACNLSQRLSAATMKTCRWRVSTMGWIFVVYLYIVDFILRNNTTTIYFTQYKPCIQIVENKM